MKTVIPSEYCPIHGCKLLPIYGYGWDVDVLVCPIASCEHLVELNITTYEEEDESGTRREVSYEIS